MIYVNLRGNLGNQMFIYAFARSIQEKTNQKICINLYDVKKNYSDFRFSLDEFVLNNNVIFESEKKLPWFANPSNIFIKLCRKFFPNLFFKVMSIFGIYIYLGPEYKNIKHFNNKKNIYIDGYWQSDKYFNSIRDILLKEFRLKKKNPILDEEMLKLDSNIVCLSVRRGDYLNSVNSKIFYNCTLDYFQDAMKLMEKENKIKGYYICSNDIDWCKDNFIANGEKIFQNTKLNAVESMIAMSKCQKFILCNSTFIWWAQYLSDSSNKVVLAPSKWLINTTNKDIYEDNWKIVDVK